MMVVDANALLKVVVSERFSEVVKDEFKRQAAAGNPIFVPDVALVESVNALWKYAFLKGTLSGKGFMETVGDLLSLWERLSIINSAGVMANAAEIAIDTGLTVYDSVYLAISKGLNVPLLTFDKGIRKKSESVSVSLVELALD